MIERERVKRGIIKKKMKTNEIPILKRLELVVNRLVRHWLCSSHHLNRKSIASGGEHC